MLIKKIFIYLYLFSFVVSCCCIFKADAHTISAEGAVVICADTGEIIYEKNSDKRLSMASTTKIMTSILAIESGKLYDLVTVTEKALTEGSSSGLNTGDKLTLESLVYGMMLESGNDAANAAALYLGGSFENFAAQMNAKAKQIGMNNTNFVTPSGLDEQDHYSTAYDMALLGVYCISDPVFREIASCKNKKINYIYPEKSVTYSNHNRLLDCCEGVFGIKTGFTQKSGRCLISACERDGITLVCVTLNDSNDWADHEYLYDSCFVQFSKTTLKPPVGSSVRVYGSTKENINIKADSYIYHFVNSNIKIKQQVILPKIIYAPIKKNDVIGRVNYYADGKIIACVDIYADEDAICKEETYKRKFSFFQWVKEKLNRKG